jgi:uncharacterized membrane protein YdcZ (DUF606 family)
LGVGPVHVYAFELAVPCSTACNNCLAELFGTILAWSFLACVLFFALVGLLITINLQRQFSRARLIFPLYAALGSLYGIAAGAGEAPPRRCVQDTTV